MPAKKVAKKKAPAKKAAPKKTAAKKTLKCPRDRKVLERLDKGRGAGGHFCCNACDGFWISGVAIKRENASGLIKLPAGLLDNIGACKTPANVLKCPEDGSRLCKVKAHDVKTGDVIIDACPSCTGIWFDQSEYGHVITKKGDVAAGSGFFNSVLVFLSQIDKR